MNRSTYLPKQLKLIQVFRGLAALLVLLHHTTGLYTTKMEYNYLNGLFSPGWSGVDFFFCLSGFIIFYISHKDIGQPNTLAQFCINRVTRIYPIVWVISLILIPVYFLVPSFGFGYEREPMVIVKSLLLLPQQKYVLGPSWTLSYEMLFYTLFGFLIYFGKRVIMPLIVIWLVVISANMFNVITFDYHLLSFIFNAHNIEFVIGCIASYIVLYKRNNLGATFIALGILGFASMWKLSLNEVLVANSPFSVLGFGLASMSLIIGSGVFELQRVVSVPAQLVFLGDASYSVYLTHAPLLSFILKVFAGLHVFEYLDYFFSVTITWVIALLLGCLFHSYIEKPMQIYLRKLFRSKFAAKKHDLETNLYQES